MAAGVPPHFGPVGETVAGDVGAEVVVDDVLRRLRARADVEEQRRLLLSLVVAAREGERRRIADDVHDDPVQVMSAVRMRLDQLKRKVTPDAAALVERLEADVELATQRLRNLIFELRPRVLETEGLVAALRASLAQLAADGSLAYELDESLSGQPAPEVAGTLYRVAQEALRNVVRHAAARNVRVRVEESRGGFLLTVSDDGVGLPCSARRVTAGHAGLVSMRERAELAGGSFDVVSVPGGGTSVTVWVPGSQA